MTQRKICTNHSVLVAIERPLPTLQRVPSEGRIKGRRKAVQSHSLSNRLIDVYERTRPEETIPATPINNLKVIVPYGLRVLLKESLQVVALPSIVQLA
jgi:hypothetical protein